MGIIFTDEEIKNLSLDNVEYDENRTLKVNELAKVTADQIIIFDEDQSNKKWTDFYLDRIISKYNDELKFLNDEERSIYDGEVEIDKAARRNENHFPATPPNVWVNLPPKKIDSQKGVPIGAYGSLTESQSIGGVNLSRQLIINGFSDGNDSTNLTNGYTISGASIDVNNITGFSINDRILVISGSVGMLATIDTITQDDGYCTGEGNPPQNNQSDCEDDNGNWTQPLSGTFGITVLTPPTSDLPSGASVQNFASGFNNGEREGTIGITPERQAVLNIFKGILDNSVQDWEDIITNNVKNAIDANEDQKRKTELTDEQGRISNRKTEINTWQAFPSNKQFGPDVESRFGDIEIGNLQNSHTGRDTEISNRTSQISDALGTLIQDVTPTGKGAFSGAGVYFDYFDWFNKRVNAAGGSLSNFYAIDVAIEVLNQDIANLDSSKDENNTLFKIVALENDADGTNEIKVADATGYSIGDAIKVIANDSIILNATITNISGTTFELNITISTDYTVAKKARILKVL